MANGISPQVIQYPQPVQYQAIPQQMPVQQAAMPMQPMNTTQGYAQPMAMQTPQQPQAVNSVGAVNIQIYNPTANAGPAYPAANFYGPQAAPYPYMPQQMNANANANANAAAQAPEAPKAEKKEEEKKDEKGGKKVLLTDEYIKTLENYLNNENPKTRMLGVKELLERFKEDKARKTDVALTALLNKALQDPSASVRFMALTTLDVGYAAGNEETIGILKQIQAQQGQSYGEDAILASQILLKSAGQIVDTPAGTGHKEPKKEESKKDKKE